MSDHSRKTHRPGGHGVEHNVRYNSFSIQTFDIGWTCQNSASILQKLQQVNAVILNAKGYGCFMGVGIGVCDVSAKLKKVFQFVRVPFNDAGEELFIHRPLDVALKGLVVVQI